MVIVDCPPLLAVTDALIVGRTAGTCLVVAHASRDSMQEVSRCLRRFAQGRVDVKGIILNGVSRGSSDYYAYEYTPKP